MAILFITVSSLVVVTVVLMKTRDLWWPPLDRRIKAHRAAKNLDAEYRELVERFRKHGKLRSDEGRPGFRQTLGTRNMLE